MTKALTEDSRDGKLEDSRDVAFTGVEGLFAGRPRTVIGRMDTI